MGENEYYEQVLRAIIILDVPMIKANYVMVELTGRMTALELTDVLLGKYELFVKELTQKVGDRYLWISLRSPQENDRLIQALRAEIDVERNDRNESGEDE